MMNKAAERNLIWSNIDIDEAMYNSLKIELPDLSENELYREYEEFNDEYINDVRQDLNIQLSQPIIIIGDIGSWNGRFSGYKMVDSGNISDCFYSDTDMTEWYVDNYGDLRATAIHHDGRNYYLYRVFKDNVSGTQIENLQNKTCQNRVLRRDITRITKRIGDEIAAVYGFNLPRQRTDKQYER